MVERKDRLIQARVPEKLETALKDEARRRRTTVSQMIRAILEDTFALVDGVVTNVDQIVSDSARLAHKVGRDARRLGRKARAGELAARTPCLDPLPDAPERLGRIPAWQEVVLNQAVPCSHCGAELERGARAYLGLGEDPGGTRAWLCPQAVAKLAGAPAENAPTAERTP